MRTAAAEATIAMVIHFCRCLIETLKTFMLGTLPRVKLFDERSRTWKLGTRTNDGEMGPARRGDVMEDIVQATPSLSQGAAMAKFHPMRPPRGFSRASKSAFVELANIWENACIEQSKRKMKMAAMVTGKEDCSFSGGQGSLTRERGASI